MTENFYRVLRATTRRDAHLVRFGKIVNIFGPVAVCSDFGINPELNEEVLELAIAPDHQAAMVLESNDKRRLIKDLQPGLLGYRLKYLKDVVGAVENPSLRSIGNPVARAIAQCVVGSPDLVNRLIALVEKKMSEQTADSVQQVALEGLLAFCHKNQDKVHIQELATHMNAILLARGESAQFSARRAGTLVKHLSFETVKLDRDGRGLCLSSEVKLRIHELAFQCGALATLTPHITCKSCLECFQKYGARVNKSMR